MTIKVKHYNANRKLVAVLTERQQGIYLPSAKGVVYVTAAGIADHMREGADLDKLLKLDITRIPVYEDAVITIEPYQGFTVEHAPEPKLVAVLTKSNAGVFVQNQCDKLGVVVLDDKGRTSSVYPNKTLEEALAEHSGRTAVYAGSSITFEV